MTLSTQRCCRANAKALRLLCFLALTLTRYRVKSSRITHASFEREAFVTSSRRAAHSEPVWNGASSLDRAGRMLLAAQSMPKCIWDNVTGAFGQCVANDYTLLSMSGKPPTESARLVPRGHTQAQAPALDCARPLNPLRHLQLLGPYSANGSCSRFFVSRFRLHAHAAHTFTQAVGVRPAPRSAVQAAHERGGVPPSHGPGVRRRC